MSKIENKLKNELRDKNIPIDKWIHERNNIPIPKTTINKLILKHFILEGNLDAVIEFEKETDEHLEFDKDLLMKRDSIRKAIIKWDIDLAISLINDLNPEILENNEILFDLQKIKFIKLIILNKTEEAILFAQDSLYHIAIKDSKIFSLFENLMVLFVHENIMNSEYKEVLTEKYIKELSSKINSSIMNLQLQNNTAHIDTLIKTMKWNQDELKNNNVNFPKILSIVPFELTDKHHSKMDLDEN